VRVGDLAEGGGHGRIVGQSRAGKKARTRLRENLVRGYSGNSSEIPLAALFGARTQAYNSVARKCRAATILSAQSPRRCAARLSLQLDSRRAEGFLLSLVSHGGEVSAGAMMRRGFVSPRVLPRKRCGVITMRSGSNSPDPWNSELGKEPFSHSWVSAGQWAGSRTSNAASIPVHN
jgi:hypothetical protein